MSESRFVRAAEVGEVRKAGCLAVPLEGHKLLLCENNGSIHAVDNRCPHMGFPLSKGTVKDGILTCHWHHARFDLASGGTFDPWTDDVRSFPVEVRGEEVWVDLSPETDPLAYQRRRLRDGLERNISLVIAKSVIFLLGQDEPATEPFGAGLEFGTQFRRDGWHQGLTIHACMMNLLPYLEDRDRQRAMVHGLSAVAVNCAGMAPHIAIHPLPTQTTDVATLKRWFREFIEVRDAEGAERCVVSAVRAGADDKQMADMLFAAATDHRYIQIGHSLDFTNKAFEALDDVGWDLAEPVLTSLVSGYASADRMEENNAWRHPIDLVEILEDAFEELPAAFEKSKNGRGPWTGRDDLVAVLLDDDAHAIAGALLEALRGGCSPVDLAGAVSYAAALRIARFHTSNQFDDWDTALHSFTFANAVEQGLKRNASAELLRGAFDAAMSVYLDRFLNIPAARLPDPGDKADDPEALLKTLPDLFDQQHHVDESGRAVARYLFGGGDADKLLSMLGRLLLREDRDFHTIQTVEGTFRQFLALRGTTAGVYVLVAAARYLAAHTPTMRAQEQNYAIAHRLHRGEALFAD